MADGISKLMMDAVAADLATISVANGYRTDLAEAAVEPKALNLRQVPSAYLGVGGTQGVLVSSTNDVRDSAVEVFQVELLVQDNDPNQALLNLKDDVRNACTKSTSTINTLPPGAAQLKIIEVGVGDFTPSGVVPLAGGNNRWVMVGSIAVAHRFTRGLA